LSVLHVKGKPLSVLRVDTNVVAAIVWVVG